MTPGEKWFHGKLEFMLSQRGKPLLVHDGYTFGIQYIRKDKKYWQCNLSRKFNCKARVTTTESGDIIVTNNLHCHNEIRQHLRKDYKINRLHNMSQSLLQQHALQMNLNRLSAVAAAQQQVDLPVNLNVNHLSGIANHSGEGSSSYSLQDPNLQMIKNEDTNDMNNNGSYSAIMIKNNGDKNGAVEPESTAIDGEGKLSIKMQG